MTALAGFVALAVDAGNLVQSGTNYQNAADAAALSAATIIRQGAGTGAEATAASDAQNIGNGYVTNDGGSPGNWASCTPPAGFTPQPTVNCVAFYQYNLAQTDVGLTATAITISAPSTALSDLRIFTGVSATLSGSGSQSTGTIKFYVIGPSPSPLTSCTGGTLVGSALVRGDKSYTPVWAPSSGFTPSQIGDYWWYAYYGGDQNFSSAQSSCTEMIVGSGAPTLTLSVPDADGANTPIVSTEITATLSGTSGVTGGDTITFTVFPYPLGSGPPSNCTTGGTEVGTATVSGGNGPYHPNAAYSPLQAGNYWWYASYTSANGDNTPANSGCGNEETIVPSSPPGPVLGVGSPDYDTVGTPVPGAAISALLSGTVNLQAGDTITFTVFGPSATAPTICTTGGTQVGSVTVPGDGSYNPASGYTPILVGEYWWYAYFNSNGDLLNPSTGSGCGPGMDEMTVGQFVPSITITAPSAETFGTPVPAADIDATLVSSSGTPLTGDIAFTVFGPESSPPLSCSSGGAMVGVDMPVNGNGTYNPSSDFPATGSPPTAPGEYWWYASYYTGDTNNLPSNSVCGVAETTIGLAAPTVTISAPNTDGSGMAISNLAISSTLSGTAGTSASATIAFWLYGRGLKPTTCPGSTGWTQLGSLVAAPGDASYNPTSGYPLTQPGDYWWYAAYSGDSGNAKADSGCGPGEMEETVVQTAENLSITAPSAGALGTAISPTATLSGPNTGTVGGTMDFWVYPGAEPTSCPDTTATGWTNVGSVLVTQYGSYSPTTGYTPTKTGEYWWYVSYSGDSNDSPTDSGCGIVIWVQVPVQQVPSLLGSGGGGTFSPFSYAFGSTTSDPKDGKLCYYPASCSAA